MSNKLYQIKKKFGYHQINAKNNHIMEYKFSEEKDYSSKIGRILTNSQKEKNEICQINNNQKISNYLNNSHHKKIYKDSLNVSLYYLPKNSIHAKKSSIPYPLISHNKNRFNNSFVSKCKVQIKPNAFLDKIYEHKTESKIKEPMTAFSKKQIKIDDLKIISTLGIGCFSIIKLVSYSNNNFNNYALKIYNRKLIKNAGHETNVIQEKLSLIKLHLCPFIIKLYKTFVDETNIYFLQEYCKCGDILQIIRDLKFASKRTIFYLAEILIALDYIHNQSIMYRDLKPENILLGNDGHIRIIDFGFSKIMNSDKTKTMCGTPGYVSPEQVKKLGYGYESDIWSYGILSFELICGYNPVYAKDPYEMMTNIIEANIKWSPHIDSIAKDLFKRILKKEPEIRLTIPEIKIHPFFQEYDFNKPELKIEAPPFELNDGSNDIIKQMHLERIKIMETKYEKRIQNLEKINYEKSQVDIFKDF